MKWARMKPAGKSKEDKQDIANSFVEFENEDDLNKAIRKKSNVWVEYKFHRPFAPAGKKGMRCFVVAGFNTTIRKCEIMRNHILFFSSGNRIE